MTILHYTIGLPPTRTGGSVQYAYDLMREQAKSQKVIALICGETLFRHSKSKIISKGFVSGIQTYELTNPLTPTLIYGISNPNLQHREVEVDFDNLNTFIKENDIQIMHLHTLMGVPLEVLSYIRKLGVKIIYTSHDFHGICPHYNLIRKDGSICRKMDLKECVRCNVNEPSDLFLRIVNSSLCHKIKKSGLLSPFRKRVVRPSIRQSYAVDFRINEEKINEYRDLINYYKKLFNLIDKIHFNSSQTEKVFKRFLPDIKGKVIPVITSGIKDNRKVLEYNKPMKIGFIGSLNEYKGFPFLKEAVSELYDEGYRNFEVLVYSGNAAGSDPDCPVINYRPPYRYSEVSEIFYELDCVVVPSKWYETFSLVALEALAHGRPVIVSDHVGAKDIVSKMNGGLVYKNPGDLKNILKDFLDNPVRVIEISKRILSAPWIYTVENHSKEMIVYYNE